jgi:sarcosine oxidase subunit beta
MSSWKKNAAAVIIGGGIMGTATAYHLARRGFEDIVLLEKDLLAQGSTGLSVGGIRQQFSHPANILLSQESVRVFERFEEEFGVDIGFKRAGYLFLAGREETWKEFMASLDAQRRLNVPVEALSPEDILRRWPYLNIDDIVGGTFCSADGYADPYVAAMGFAAAARRLGVRVEEMTRVTGIQVAGNTVQGVETEQGAITSPLVVNAAGPWAAKVAELAGQVLPVRPFRRQVFLTDAIEMLPQPVPMIIDQEVTFYLRGAAPGLIMGMSDPHEPPSFHLHIDREFMEKVAEAAVHRVPILENAGIVRGWAGLYEITPDDNPIIGEMPSLRGFYCAVGFSGHGFQHGPAVGRILSELILDGRTDFDLAPYSFDRFGQMSQGEKRVV